MLNCALSSAPTNVRIRALYSLSHRFCKSNRNAKDLKANVTKIRFDKFLLHWRWANFCQLISAHTERDWHPGISRNASLTCAVSLDRWPQERSLDVHRIVHVYTKLALKFQEWSRIRFFFFEQNGHASLAICEEISVFECNVACVCIRQIDRCW